MPFDFTGAVPLALVFALLTGFDFAEVDEEVPAACCRLASAAFFNRCSSARESTNDDETHRTDERTNLRVSSVSIRVTFVDALLDVAGRESSVFLLDRPLDSFRFAALVFLFSVALLPRPTKHRRHRRLTKSLSLLFERPFDYFDQRR